VTNPIGTVDGGVRVVLRLEGTAVLAGALAAYAGTGRSWWLLAALLLAPDVAMLGYLAGPRIGALAYNAAHSYIGPIALAVVSRGSGLGAALACIWFAHCGLDRALGYGLKYASAFTDTHLGRIGSRTARPSAG
jgi:hypothetical protein